ncbi:MAG: aminodeoxychorismate synthase component I, partial [Alphaproteobacteria bacterium]|nr:aminodeoxychorismate synthase component I [Alphaproteobacteria bacterium]
MAHLPDNAPFVLLDDARAAGAAPARLYRDPVSVVQADSAEDVEDALAEVADAQARGLHAAGFITFEAGYALEPKLAGKAYGNADPLLWFGQFDRYDEIAPEDVPALLPQPQSGWLGVPEPHITRADYTQAFARVQVLIEAGDIYQANLTYPADVACAGHPLSLYAGLRMRANAPYGGIIFTGSNWLLSASPELFFTLHNGKLIAKPMKGTAARTGDDASEIEALLDDPKQRAENLMIVDLLRNDLSRVAEAGSVKVPALFDVETYRHVHQMTSTVAARLRADLSATDVLRTLFPCGSVTGAPKIRAMEVIAEVERTARGAYTGSIGRIDANGDAVFNVAIRTLALQNGANKAVLGLGSGIVADSMESDEWAECAVKGAFVMSPVAFDLIETMRFDPDA